MGHNAEAQLASAGFHLEPRRARAEEPSAQLQSTEQQQPNPQPADTDLSNLPYPRWMTLLTRGCLFLFEVVVLGYGIWFIKKWESDPKFMERNRNQDTAIAAAGVAMGLDLTACVLTLFRRYGEWWVWVLVAVGDVAVGITAILGAISVMWVDHNGYSREELGWFWEDDMSVLGTLAVVVGVTHIVASFGGCAGCCIVGRSPKSPSRPRR